MANSRELTEAVSRALSVEEKTVAVHTRFLREEGLLSKAGRGPGAAKMTPMDAANLMISVAAGTSVGEAAETTRRFAGLPFGQRDLTTALPHPQWPARPVIANLNPDQVKRSFGLKDIDDRHDFGAALAAVIHAAETGTLFPELRPSYFDKPEHAKPRSYDRALLVRVYLPKPFATITYRASGILTERVSFGGPVHLDSYSYRDTVLKEKNRGKSTKTPNASYLVQMREFTESSIMIVAETLGNSRA